MCAEIKENLAQKLLLYAVTDRHWLNGRSLYDVVKESLDGGVTFLQLREKDLDDETFYEEAVRLQALAAEYHVPFIVNDNVDIALRMNADGIHVGQHDMEAGDVRALIGPDKILGVSAQTVEQALLAEKRGADYLGVGAVFPTGSKDDADDVSYETLQAICKAVSIPVVAIGGITRENIPLLAGSGICGIAVISAIYAQEDIREAAAGLREVTNEMVGPKEKAGSPQETTCAAVSHQELSFGNNIRGVIFDIDGVLLNSLEIWTDLGARYLKQIGKEPEQGLTQILHSMSMEEGAAYLREHYQTQQTAEQILEGLQDMMRSYYFHEVMAKPDVRRFMEMLKSRGVRMSAATSSPRAHVEKALERNGLLPYLDQIFTCSEIGTGKHEPDIYDAAASCMGTSRRETCVFEDTLYALKTAACAGYRTVGIRDELGEPDQEGLRKTADIYISKFSELL